LNIIISLILLMLTMLLSQCLISSKQTVSSNQCLCWYTEFKLSWPKTKLENVGAGDPPSTILIDHSSYAVLPTIDRLQLGWLTRGVDPGGWQVVTSLKICRTERNRTLLPQAKVLMAGCQNSQHGHLCWLVRVRN